MALFSVADIVVAVFLLIIVIDSAFRQDDRKSSKALFATLIASIVMVVLDSLSGFELPASTPVVALYVAEAVSVIATKVILMFFYFYCYRYFCERADTNKWLFIVPMVLLAITIVVQVVRVFTVDQVMLVDGFIVVIGDMPTIIRLASVALPLYLPVLAIFKRKKIGSTVIAFAFAPAVAGILVSFVGLHDFSTAAGALVIFFTYVFLQNGAANQREKERQTLEANNAELEALNSELEERQAQLEEVSAEQEAQIEEISALNSELEKVNADLADREDELRQARDAANAANVAKTSFLFNMSHDIRTPMNAIVGFTELLRKHQDDPERRADYLNKIDGASKSLLSIINNVLDMARIESGSAKIEEVPWTVGQACGAIHEMFDALMEEKGLIFSQETHVEHRFVYADPTKLNQVLTNLVSNAWKYTEPGGKVSILTEELECDREGYVFIRTSVIDTGIGMDADYLPHLFEEFSRENTSTDSKVEGSGLGMPIVKSLVDLMGGTLEVESEKGVGSTFRVTLPHRIAAEGEAAEEVAQEVDPAAFEGRRILLAEDNDLNAEIAIELLGEAGFEIDRAEDGQVCVDMLRGASEGAYDVVLMDVQMPNMNGYEATAAIRAMEDKAKADIPILAMTANAFEEDKREAFRAGMNGHIAKPINVAELMKALAGALN